MFFLGNFEWFGHVSNSPCGVESLYDLGKYPGMIKFLIHRVELKGMFKKHFLIYFFEFLIHRVELKAVDKTSLLFFLLCF